MTLSSQISGRFNGESKEKPVIFMDAGIHSNEWIAPATLIFFINEVAIAA